MSTGNFIFIIPAAAIIAAAIVFKAILDYWGHYKLTKINKTENFSQGVNSNLFVHDPLLTLKWAFLLFGVGFALILREIIIPHLSLEGTFGLMFLFAGIGLILFFVFYERKAKSKK